MKSVVLLLVLLGVLAAGCGKDSAPVPSADDPNSNANASKMEPQMGGEEPSVKGN